MSDRHFLLIYDLAPDYLERPMYRGTHLAMAREAVARRTNLAALC